MAMSGSLCRMILCSSVVLCRDGIASLETTDLCSGFDGNTLFDFIFTQCLLSDIVVLSHDRGSAIENIRFYY